MTRYYADVRLEITVSFEDDGEMSLEDQAAEAVWSHDFAPPSRGPTMASCRECKLYDLDAAQLAGGEGCP